MAEELVWSRKFIVFPDENAFPEGDQRLIHAAREASMMAYAPYSNFRVGAALLMADGTVVTGANQENAAYPQGSCAEKVAFYKAATSGSRQDIIKVAIVAEKNGVFEPATPCGGCRQVMLETEAVQGRNIELIMWVEPEKWIKTKSIKSLLPFSFRL